MAWRLRCRNVFEVLTDGAQISIFGDGEWSEAAAKGLLGGTDGATNSIVLSIRMVNLSFKNERFSF